MAQPYATITIEAGDVVYRAEESETGIQSLIDMLERARREGATTVVFFSGNYRGPKYVRFPDHYGWLSDDD